MRVLARPSASCSGCWPRWTAESCGRASALTIWPTGWACATECRTGRPSGGSAHALQELPVLSKAFASGEVGIDKAVELARFATGETEERLLAWAGEVSCGAIRRKGDLALRERKHDAEADRERSLRWWVFRRGTAARPAGGAPRRRRRDRGQGPG